MVYKQIQKQPNMYCQIIFNGKGSTFSTNKVETTGYAQESKLTLAATSGHKERLI